MRRFYMYMITLCILSITSFAHAAQSDSVTVRVRVTPLIPPLPSIVTTDGYKLMLQKRNADSTLQPAVAYTMNGVCWSPASKGTSGPELDERGMRGEFSNWVEIDVPLIKNMNANTIRTFMDFGFTAEFAKDWRYILDKCYENGIMVIPTVDRCIADLDRIEDIVNEYKDHPAILMWLIGNEWNINLFYGGVRDKDGDGDVDVYDSAIAAEDAARLIKSLDSNHPVVSSYGEPNIPSFTITKDIIKNRCPSFDVWAFNIYRGKTAGNLFDQWKEICLESTRKPMFLAEFGCDAYDINKDREDQTAQRNWEYYQWDYIRQNLSSKDDSRVSVGGCVFEFNDEWWKVRNPYDPWTQQKEGWYTSNCPDGHASEEWWGITDIDRKPREAYGMFQIFFGGGEPEPPPVPTVVRFSTQPDVVFTNLKDYLIMDVFENTSEVKINGEIITLDVYDGFRKDVTLAQGNNPFDLEVTFEDGKKELYQKIITYDPAYSTADKKLLYANDIVIDLNGNAILGKLPWPPAAVSHDGKYFLAQGTSLKGEVYSTADNGLVKQLNLTSLSYHPFFSQDDKILYSDYEILDFESNSIIGRLPAAATKVANDNYIFNLSYHGDSTYGYYHIKKMDPVTYQIIISMDGRLMRRFFGGMNISVDGGLAFYTSYSYAIGALDIINTETGEQIVYDRLSDYMGDVEPSYDGRKILLGGYGNSYYGRGGIDVLDKDTKTIKSFYPQFGARRLCVSPEYVFATSTCVEHNGMKGSIYHRGIEVLKLNDKSELEFQKSFFLCYPHDYNMPIRILHKKDY